MNPTENYLLNFLKNHYPSTNNKILASKLGVSEHTLRKKAAKYGIKKNPQYLKQLHDNLMVSKKKKFEDSIKDYSLDQIERNIIVGSLLGDGSLALYGRSKNAHYREHGAYSQNPYRQWKAEMLSKLDFKFNTKGKNAKLSSPSHPIYTELYNLFYKNGIKILTPENIQLLDHPIGLTCLYLDDGSLVINATQRRNIINPTPYVYIYSLNFTKNENILLKNHIKSVFDIEFSLKRHPDGKNYMLQLCKRNELMKFINIVKPYADRIPCMQYKVDVKARLDEKVLNLKTSHPDQHIANCPLTVIDKTYSLGDEQLIIQLKKQGVSDQKIANRLHRPYWGVVDKIRRLRQEGKLKK